MSEPDLTPLIEGLVGEGVETIWLAGSRARGDEGPYSDIDIGVLQNSPRRRQFLVYEGVLTSVVRTTTAATRASFLDPGQLGGAVPGWRSAKLFHDPAQVGAAIQAEARAWSWGQVTAACDAWVARELVQLSEEVHKLFNALSAGDELAAAARRNVLALRLPLVASVRRRVLYDSEKHLVRLVGEEMGSAWMNAQRDALLPMGDLPQTMTLGSCRMYALLAADCMSLLSDEQRAVVRLAVNLIESVR